MRSFSRDSISSIEKSMEVETPRPSHRCNFTDRGDWSMQKVMGESCEPAPLGDKWYGGYEDSLFEQRMLDVIESHNPAEPLFLFWAPHAVHTPYEAPRSFMERFDFIAETEVGDTYPTADRQRYAAMTSFIDTAVGNVTDALRAAGMWDDLLILSTADNGGPVYRGNGWSSPIEFVGTGHMGGNNFPLKGGKLTNWEGCVIARANISSAMTSPPDD
jgi:arylsulfatase A-like enzyme